ncbi:MAG: hypothetical protein V4675_03805 [Verrucomicrobiota bacterium]
MHTARFRSVVAKAGRPQTHLQLVAPEKDAELQAALQKNRVMSVTRTVVGNGKDYAVVGYEGGAVSQLLIFPKSLEKFKDRRIVGLDYTLLDEPVATSAAKPKPKPKPVPIPVEVPAPAPLRTPPSSKPVEAGHPGPPPKAPLGRPRKRTATTVKTRDVPHKKKTMSLKQLRSLLAKVLLEWDRGHDVKANKMLAKIVDGL